MSSRIGSEAATRSGAGIETRSSLTERYDEVRRASTALAEGLSPEDCTVQSMPDASPTKWHLAHTTWFFETFVLEHGVSSYRPFHPRYRVLFNSYYNTVGEQHPRPRRGEITRPGLGEVLDYREHVDRAMHQLLRSIGGRGDGDGLRAVVEVGLHHEQQHQELILTDVKHLLSCNPLLPAFRACPEPPRGELAPLRWLAHEGGIHEIGHAGPGFCYDNETPRHRVLLRPFALASRTVTNGEYLEFVEDRGYERPELWLADGWDALRRHGWRSPDYWIRRDGAWLTQTLGGPRELRLDEPVCHVSFYEAEAYARWAGERLPGEAEWEVAAEAAALEGNFVEDGYFHPVPPVAGADDVPRQLFGNVWEWTQSPYVAYPGYRPLEGSLGEYNGKFMCNQMVLRGGSCATPRSHIRASYRNFFYPDQRWQFVGIRLARDV